jgi:hypothetical protein
MNLARPMWITVLFSTRNQYVNSFLKVVVVAMIRSWVTANIGEVMVIEQPSRKGMIALERLGKGSPVFFV